MIVLFQVGDPFSGWGSFFRLRILHYWTQLTLCSCWWCFQAGQVAQPGANWLPNQPPAQLLPPHRPVPRTLCLLCKLNMFNCSKCAILIPRSSLPFLWTPNNVTCLYNHVHRASLQKSLHMCSACLHQWRVPQVALKYPCNLPSPGGTITWRPPPPWQPENCSAGGGGGVTWTPAEGGGGVLEKWGSVSGPLFCVRTDVGAKGTGTQNLARKSFFHQ